MCERSWTLPSVLVAAEQHPEILSRLEITAVILVLSALTGALFSMAPSLARLLGASGMGVVTRVMGMILVAIAMGMLTEGLAALMPGLAG